MIRIVCRARRIVSGSGTERVAHQDDRAGLGGDVGADAAQGEPDIGQRQRRGVVDAVADHGHDAALVLAAWTHSALSAGVSSASTCLTWTFLATAARGRGAVAGEDGQVLEAQVLQVVDDVVRLAARTLSRAPIAPATAPSTATSRAVWPDSSSVSRASSTSAGIAMSRSRTGGGCRPGRFSPAVSRRPSPTPPRRAGPGSRRPRRGAVPDARGLGDEQPGQRDARSAARRRRPGEQVVARLQGGRRHAIAQLGPALGQRAGLVEGERVDPRQPLERRPPLDQHAPPASRAVAASTAAGVARIRAHGQATTSTARVGIRSIDRRACRPGTSPRAPERWSPGRRAASPRRTAGRNSRA